MWGIIPAAGQGTRIQPLAFSKELLPIGSRVDERGVERPRAVSEYLVERMVRGGASKICFVISPWKSDILQYYGGSLGDTAFAYVVQNQATGLCDAIFRALPLIGPDEPVLLGLPDTVWFPEDALASLPDDRLSFLLFPVENPSLFDAVLLDASGRVTAIEVKTAAPRTNWVWGAFKLPAPCCIASTHSGSHASGRISISALWSTPTWQRVARPGACAPARTTWTWARCTDTAKPCARWTAR